MHRVMHSACNKITLIMQFQNNLPLRLDKNFVYFKTLWNLSRGTSRIVG